MTRQLKPLEWVQDDDGGWYCPIRNTQGECVGACYHNALVYDIYWHGPDATRVQRLDNGHLAATDDESRHREVEAELAPILERYELPPGLWEDPPLTPAFVSQVWGGADARWPDGAISWSGRPDRGSSLMWVQYASHCGYVLHRGAVFHLKLTTESQLLAAMHAFGVERADGEEK